MHARWQCECIFANSKMHECLFKLLLPHFTTNSHKFGARIEDICRFTKSGLQVVQWNVRKLTKTSGCNLSLNTLSRNSAQPFIKQKNPCHLYFYIKWATLPFLAIFNIGNDGPYKEFFLHHGFIVLFILLQIQSKME